MGVKCLAQEHNAVPQPGLEPGTSDPESSALTIRPPRLPRFLFMDGGIFGNLTTFWFTCVHLRNSQLVGRGQTGCKSQKVVN